MRISLEFSGKVICSSLVQSVKQLGPMISSDDGRAIDFKAMQWENAFSEISRNCEGEENEIF
jgi:hypothetical protein